MTIDKIFHDLKIENHKDLLGFEWLNSEDSYPGTDLPFLSKDFIHIYSRQAGLSQETIDYLCCRLIPLVKSNPALARFMWHQHYLMNICVSPCRPDAGGFPQMEHLLGTDGYTYNLMLALAGYPAAGEIYKNLCIPEKIRNETFADLRIWCDFFKQTSGVVGITPGILSWSLLYLKGKLFQLGRLQFMPGIFRENIIVLRNMKTGNVQAFATDKISYDATGLIVNKSEEKESQIIGNPISPDGYIAPPKQTISLYDWFPIVKPGDTILDIHIPASGPMTIDACANSIKQAALFFPQHWPQYTDIKCFVCRSWLFDPQLKNILSPESNIVKFQHEFYCFPVIHENSHDSAIWHIWGDVSQYASVKDYPQDTSLQKAFVSFMLNNGRFRCGGGFFLKEDIPFGRQIYRTHSIKQN